MARVHYRHKNKRVKKDVYEAALIVYGMSRSGKEWESSSPSEEHISGSISSDVIDEQPPVNEAPAINDDENVPLALEEVGGAPAVIPPLAMEEVGGAPAAIPPLAMEEVGGAPAMILPLAMEEVGGAPAMIPPLAMEEVGGALAVIPPLAAIGNIIGACSPPLEKRLTKSDVTDGQGRVILRKEFVTTHLVPMFNADEVPSEGIDVTVFDAEGRQYEMTFKLWASKLYVLTKGWKEFYKANDLTEAGQYVTLWMFRHVETHMPCFAIAPGRFGVP